jgi:DNA-binding winged helix-turn-helix (wHTH) protein
MATAPPETTAPTAATRAYRFDEFTLDVAGRKLLRGDTATALPSRAFDALVYLLERRERLVQKNELIDAIWPDVVVTDDSLTHAISVVRRALADERAHPKYIETVPRRGYRFIGAVRTDEIARGVEPTANESAAAPTTQVTAPSPPSSKPSRLAWVAAGAAACAVLIALSAFLTRPEPTLEGAARSVWLSQP